MGVIVRSSGCIGDPLSTLEHPTVDREGARLEKQNFNFCSISVFGLALLGNLPML